MSVEHNVYIGKYIKVDSWNASVISKEVIQGCSNKVNCKNNFSNKNLDQMNFCPECGAKVVPIEVEITNIKHYNVDVICDELFGVDVFNFQDQYIFYVDGGNISKIVSDDYEFDLSKMFEYLKNKTEDDQVDILSKHLTKLGIKHEVKFGAVGYYC